MGVEVGGGGGFPGQVGQVMFWGPVAVRAGGTTAAAGGS